jgi:hypothetical protein
MSPTVFRYKNYRFLFFSREEQRIHVHVSSSDGEAKFWIAPEVELAYNHGLSERQIQELKRVVEEHRHEIQDTWDRHFRG